MPSVVGRLRLLLLLPLSRRSDSAEDGPSVIERSLGEEERTCTRSAEKSEEKEKDSAVEAPLLLLLDEGSSSSMMTFFSLVFFACGARGERKIEFSTEERKETSGEGKEATRDTK